jgi:hypothetical protein
MSGFYKTKYILLITTICLLSGCHTVSQNTGGSTKSPMPEVTTDIVDVKPAETIYPTYDKEYTDEEKLKKAISLIQYKKYPQAIGLLSQLKDNEKATDLLEQLRYIISGAYIANLNAGVAAIDNEGKVKIIIDDNVYKYYRYDEVSGWTNIKQLSFAQDRLDALDKNGVIHSTNDTDSSYQYVADQLKSYTNLVIISTSFDNYALLSRTSNIFSYSEKSSEALNAFQDEISSWKDVVDVVSGQIRIVALKRDGKVSVVDFSKDSHIYDEVADWNDIIAISADTVGSIAGLKSDGTVVMSKSEVAPPFLYKVSGWNDIIAISKSSTTLLGLKRDGTVVATGDNRQMQLEVSDWTDIVAVAAGNWISIGLKSDGTLVLAGKTEEGVTTPNVSGVNNLYVPTISY